MILLKNYEGENTVQKTVSMQIDYLVSKLSEPVNLSLAEFIGEKLVSDIIFDWGRSKPPVLYYQKMIFSMLIKKQNFL